MTNAKPSKNSPKEILVEMAVEGTANYIEAQRILLDLAQQENEIVLNGVGQRVSGYAPIAAVTNVIRRGIDTFLDMQQNLLTIASKRTQGLLESSQGTGTADINPVSLAAEAMEEFVAAQKKFLNVISEESRMDVKKEKKSDQIEVAELGREATNAFIKAQKKLLDLAGQQVNVNIQAVSRVGEFKMPLRFAPVADMANDGVKNFVDAEKALVDTIIKTRNRVKETTAHPKPQPKAKTPRVRNRVKPTPAHAKPQPKAKTPRVAVVAQA